MFSCIVFQCFYRSMLYSNGAVLPSYDVCPSVCLSVRDVGDSWSHMLGYVEFYYTVN